MSDTERNGTVERDDLPHELYASHVDFVRIGVKTMTAQRMIGWLREYAEFCEVAGNSTTADHAWHVSNLLASEVEPESIEKRSVDADTDWPDTEDLDE